MTDQTLLQFVEELESIDAQIADLKADRKLVLEQAKNEGFDPKTINKVVVERAAERAALLEGIALLGTYRVAVGIIA